ncbi:hypothetical protein ACFQFH_06270 [Halobaculum halobium]|uniref:Uncharacterized protein n=1 Tax=Halobaculum halobium TaxID=3032281 RepID=A0ABD5TDE6_9EURY|nr:hypothetical protein [Halobaculum sp. SYNS20]
MSAPSRGPDDEDLATLVSELEATLTDLRTELTDRERADRLTDEGDRRPPDDRSNRRERGRRPPRPPAPGELFRFTADYTIPTVVAVLEATIEALELLRGVIDLAAPGETADGRRRWNRRARGDSRGLARSVLSDAVGEGVTAATDRAAGDAADALSRLRETLAEADLPEDDERRDLVSDARELSEELERRVRESRDVVDRERGRERRTNSGRDDGPVSIAVGDPDESSNGGASGSAPPDEDRTGSEDRDSDDGDDAGDADSADGRPEVDVDAELESIKREMGGGTDNRESGSDGDDNGDETADAADDADEDDSSA